MKTTANATVDHLSKYLALRIALEDGQTNGETEDRGREEGRGEERGAAAGGGETKATAGSGEGSSLNNISEKQYTIYIMTRGGQFSVSNKTNTLQQRCLKMSTCHGPNPPKYSFVPWSALSYTAFRTVHRSRANVKL